jgi:hypothetical protein
MVAFRAGVLAHGPEAQAMPALTQRKGPEVDPPRPADRGAEAVERPADHLTIHGYLDQPALRTGHEVDSQRVRSAPGYFEPEIDNQGQPRGEGGSQAWRDLREVADPLAGPVEEETAQVGQVYRRALEQVRGEFEERTWQMFWLTTIEGRSPVSLAAEMGVTPAAVRQARSRVLRRLEQEAGDLLD